MAKLFGTDGVRGKANVYPMTVDFAQKLGQVAGKLLATEKGRVAICRDTRVSGQMLEAALVAGFTSVGVDVVVIGVLPTPAMAALAEFYDVDLAVVISASHNPYFDNGIKLMDGKGNKLSDVETQKLEAGIATDVVTLDPEKIGKVEKVQGADVKYAHLSKQVLKDGESLKGLRVVLDCANGVLFEIMPEVFKSLGAGVIAMGTEPNGYNINKECGSTAPAKMIETVINSNAHLGIAVDGDGDRIIICDEKGNRLDGDQIIAFLAKTLKENGELKSNAVVATILSNVGLEKFVKSMGVEYYSTSVGERYVVEKMKEIGSNVGGEESGHMVLSDYAKGGDSLVVALVVSLALLKSGKKMSDIFPVFAPVAKKRVDLRFESKESIVKALADEKVKQIISESENLVKDKGRILVRASGTEPKVQVWVWCEDEKLLEKLSDNMVGEIAAFGGAPKQVA